MKKNISLSFSDRSTQITSSSSNKTLSTLSMKKSRISLKCSQIENALMIKEYDDVYKSECHDNIDNEINLYTELANIEVNLLCNFDDNKIFTIPMSLSQSTTIEEVFTRAIEIFNEKDYEITIKKQSFIVKLINDIKLFYVKPSKKNKTPKFDYPPFDSKTTLGILPYTRLSLFSKEGVMAIELTKKKEQKSTCVKRCIIF